MNCNMVWCQIQHLWLKFSWSFIYVIICHSDYFIRNKLHCSISIDRNKTFTISTISWLFFSVKKWMKMFYVVNCQCQIDMWNEKSRYEIQRLTQMPESNKKYSALRTLHHFNHCLSPYGSWVMAILIFRICQIWPQVDTWEKWHILWYIFRSNHYTYNAKNASEKSWYIKKNMQWPKYQWKHSMHWLSCIQIRKKNIFSVLEINHINIDVQPCPPTPLVLWDIKEQDYISTNESIKFKKRVPTAI